MFEIKVDQQWKRYECSRSYADSLFFSLCIFFKCMNNKIAIIRHDQFLQILLRQVCLFTMSYTGSPRLRWIWVSYLGYLINDKAEEQ